MTRKTEFTKKAEGITDLMTYISKKSGGCGERTIGKCTTCSREFMPYKEFPDELYRKEYTISGMCKNCQDQVFGQKEV